MTGYTTQEVSSLIGLKPHQVRHFVRRELLNPERGDKGEYLFSFQDVVLLRTAKGLLDSAVTPRRALKVLVRLKRQLPHLPSLSAMRIVRDGASLLVRSENRAWDAETGQTQFAFDQPTRPVSVTTMLGDDLDIIPEAGALTSDEWYNLGLDLEEANPDKAPEAYQRALDLDPNNADAHVNAGRLYQLKGNLRYAKRHYETALRIAPEHQLANYNLGTIFDELDELERAREYYEKATAIPDAHYNLARIAELGGDQVSARRAMRRYRDLIENNADS